MIKNVSIIDLKAHVDDRGYLIEILRQTDPHFTGFGQVYMVGNFAKGTIRAFHRHQKLWDWFFISHGSAKFVLVDGRSIGHSATETEMIKLNLHDLTDREMNTFVTSSRNPSLICVPPGVYHGWMALEDDTQLISIASEVYNRENPDEERISPNSFGDVWPVKGR